MIDNLTKNRIIDTANIVDVVSDFVSLRKRGVNYVGLCPFHADNHPSFYVTPAKNICKCFSCGEGGSPVVFIMKHEKLSYNEALKYLAKKYHIEVKDRELTDEEKQYETNLEGMMIVNNWAQKHFASRLMEHEEGRNIGLRYFAERGFREDIITKFGLGYSLEQRDDLYNAAIKSGYNKDFLEKTGLVLFYENGVASDRFRGRVIFPVHTVSGKVVAFGGRILKKNEKTAKYINSPDSDIYHKNKELYGIFFARKAITAEDKCYLVEGYTDVISMHQSGIENVVASSGTALTEGQINLIHRMTENITVLYDGDMAGIKAAIRGIDLLLQEGMNVKVVLLPEGEDPDSFAQSHNAKQLSDFLEDNETDFIKFKTDLLLKEAGNDPIKRAGFVSDIIRTIAVIPDSIKRAFYIKECSDLMDIKEQTLISTLNKTRASMPRKKKTDEAEQKTGAEVEQENPPAAQPDAEIVKELTESKVSSSFRRFEESLLRFVVQHGERVLYGSTTVAEFIMSELNNDGYDIQTPEFKAIITETIQHGKDANFVAFRHFLSHPDPNISMTAMALADDNYKIDFGLDTNEMQSDASDNRIYDELERTAKIKEKIESFKGILVNDIVALKDAHIMHDINMINDKIKALQKEGNLNEAIELTKTLIEKNEIKQKLSKMLGDERVIRRI
ncbi:MAG: DNA primase [Tannerella sp.]|nr:DNA primase [Tannerella sp.]